MEKEFTHCFFSGLSGIQLPIPKYRYPPPFENTSRLTYYSTFFNSIEINSSFYKVPRPATVTKWAASVPEHFKFSFKLWKEITHAQEFNFKEEEITQFFKSINSVDNKKGCLLIQFPPRMGKEYIARLDKLLSLTWELGGGDWNIAIEFRNTSWYNKMTYDLINRFKAALVIHDIPKSSTPMITHVSDFIYIRFHGPAGNYRDSYPEYFLSEYATYIKEWIAEGKKVYIYFNNTMGDAFHNLRTINSFLSNNHSLIQ